MPPRPERVLLIRSGRHLSVAMHALWEASPGCRIKVVATPGTEAALRQEGLTPADWFIFRTRPSFDAWPLLAGGLFFRLRLSGYDRVAVLWQDPEGTDRANVDRAALALSPRGFTAITPDGRLHNRPGLAAVARQARQAAASMGVAAFLWTFLYAPARVLQVVRR